VLRSGQLTCPETLRTRIIALAERIVLVVMALRTTHRGSHPHGHGGVDSIDNRLDAKLFQVSACFVTEGRVAMEAGGNALVVSGVGQEVAGKLFDRKSIERQAAVEGVDHPVAIEPDVSWSVAFIAVRVGIGGMSSHQAAIRSPYCSQWSNRSTTFS
jgi:hypothetical protein